MKSERSDVNLRKSICLPAIKRQVFFYVGQGNNGELVRQVMQNRPGFSEQRTPFNVHFLWKPSNKYFNYLQLGQLKTKKICINHLEHHSSITNKNKLFQNLEAFCLQTKANLSDFVPQTFILNLDSPQLQQDIAQFVEHFLTLENTCRNVWLLKPPDLNRGQGIKLFEDLETFAELIEQISKKSGVKQSRLITVQIDNKQKIRFSIDDVGSDRTVVLQKYLEAPLLYNLRKFDIRVWVLVDHRLNYYLFKEGYCRMACERFDIRNLKNLYIHLTNNAIQQHHQNYGKYELGNQISFQDLQKYLKYQKPQMNQIIGEIKRLVRLTFDAAYSKINECRRQYQFEVFGYDFMVDKDGHVYLIEVNTNPCLEESSPLLKQLIPRMIDDAFKITIDQIYEAESGPPYAYPVKGYSDHENLWEKLGQI